MTTDAPAPPTPAALVAWAAGQTAAFHKALAAAVETYAATGVAPKSITAGGGGTAAADGDGKKTRAKKDKDAPKRPPTPYNIFVKERAAVLKEKGFDPKAEHTTLMNKVADEWKSMSAAEKDAYAANVIARGKAVGKRGSPPPAAAAALPATPAAAAGGGGGADAAEEERRRKKAEKRARKEAAKAAALEAGGAPAHKKHKHSHE